MELNNFPPLKPRVVLGIAAHPDDLDFCAAGTMAKFAEAGADVYYLIITDGSKGSDDKKMSSPQLIKIRELEQREAVKVLGCSDVEFLRYKDSELEISMQLKKDIVRVIRKLKPDVVVTIDPSMFYSAQRGFINHPDHRAVGQATLDAVYPLARDHLAFPEFFEQGYKPHKTTTILLSNFDNGNYIVDISKTFAKKIAALKAHGSQKLDVESVHSWLEELDKQSGDKAGYKYGESFVRINIRI